MSQYKTIPLSYLTAQAHPECTHTIFQQECFKLRTGKYNGVITHQGEILRFALKTLPESLEVCSFCPIPFNQRSLRLGWFKGNDNINLISATIHTSHAFWLVHPRLEECLDIPTLADIKSDDR